MDKQRSAVPPPLRQGLTRRHLAMMVASAALMGMSPLQRAVVLGRSQGPSLDLNFLRGALDPRISFSRGSSGSYFDATGTLQQAATNVPRFDYGATPVGAVPLGLLIEEQRTNSIRNNTGQGAVAGSPGTLPTNWITALPAGITQTVVGVGSESGIAYIDLQFTGTCTSTGNVVVFRPDNGTGTSAATGQAWTGSFYQRIVGGALPPEAAPALSWEELTSALAYVTGGSASISTPTGAALSTQRIQNTRTLSGGATVAAVRFYAQFTVNTGTALNVTVRIGLPSLELGAFATSPIITTGSAVTRAPDVASMPFAALYNPKAGSFVAEVAFDRPSTQAGIRAGAFMLCDGTYNNYISIYSDSGQSSITAAMVENAGSNLLPGVSQPYTANEPVKLGLAYGSINAVASGSNSQSTAGTAGPPTNGTLYLGIAADTTGWLLNGYLRRIRYWPRALSQSELQGVTR